MYILYKGKKTIVWDNSGNSQAESVTFSAVVKKFITSGAKNKKSSFALAVAVKTNKCAYVYENIL